MFFCHCGSHIQDYPGCSKHQISTVLLFSSSRGLLNAPHLRRDITVWLSWLTPECTEPNSHSNGNSAKCQLLTVQPQELSILTVLLSSKELHIQGVGHTHFPREGQICRLTLSQQIHHQVCSLPIKLSALSHDWCPTFTLT